MDKDSKHYQFLSVTDFTWVYFSWSNQFKQLSQDSTCDFFYSFSKAFYQNVSCQTGGEAFLLVFLVLFTKEGQLVAYKSLI